MEEKIPWWAAPTLRATATAAAPIIVLLAKSLIHVEWKVETVVDVTLATAGACGLFVIWRRRVHAGKDPSNPAPPIDPKRVL